MVQTKREYDGSLFAWLGAVIVGHLPFTATRLDPASINPYRRDVSDDVQQKLDEVKKFIAGVGIRVMARRGQK